MPVDTPTTTTFKITRICLYCDTPLRYDEIGLTCYRCHRWRRRCAMRTAKLSIEELYELEEYSRQIYSRPPTPEDLELQEIAQQADAWERTRHAD